jgi:AraC-like DNA-binding protein
MNKLKESNMMKKTILVIGDGRGFKSILGNALLSGYQILYRRSVEGDLPEVFEEGVELIILDNVRPSFKMVDILEQARRLNPLVPIITTMSLAFEDVFAKNVLNGHDKLHNNSGDVHDLHNVIENLANGVGLREEVNGKLSCRRLQDFTLIQWDDETPHWLRDESIRRSVKFIECHYFEQISLRDIADAACLSPYHFCRLFKRWLGTSCMKYLTNVRIEKAKQLLQDSSLSITQICFDIGFNDLTHFERVFKSQTGMTPSAYRKENGLIEQERWKERQYGPSQRYPPRFIFA